MLTSRYLIFFAVCVFPFWLISQNNIEFQQLLGENVSTQSITYAITQDSVGNVWIASEEGVLKHNSQFYKIYNIYNGLPESASNRTSEIFYDSKGRIWIGLEKGVGLYNPELDIFDLITIPNEPNPSLVNAIIEDKQGDIWIGAFNGLWKISKIEGELILERILADPHVQDITCVENQIILGTNSGLFKLNKGQNQIFEIPFNQPDKNISYTGMIKNNVLVGTKTGQLYSTTKNLDDWQSIELVNTKNSPINDVVQDEDGRIYVGTDGSGIIVLDSLYNRIDHYHEDVDNLGSISSNGVYDLFIGNEDILWVATYGGGINYFDSNKLPFIKIQHRINDKNSIAANFTRAIEIDNNGNYWFGTKQGVSFWNRKNNEWRHFKSLADEGKSNPDIVMCMEKDANSIWVGTYNNGLYKINIDNFDISPISALQPELILKRIYSLFKDSNGNLWMGGIDAPLSVIRPNGRIDTYPIQPIKNIQESSTGAIYAVGRNGVYVINDDTKKFRIITELSPNNSLPYSTVSSISELSDGKLLLATNGAGLLFYDPNTSKISRITVNNGLPSDIAQGIVIKNDQNYWISTARGLAQVVTNKRDTMINLFDKRDGLASSEFNYGSYAKLSDSLYAFGGVDGVTLFNPAEIQEQVYEPSLVFNDLKLDNQSVNIGSNPLKTHVNETDKLVLNHDQNSLEISFTGILHSTSSKVNYSWVLEGYQNNWSEPSPTNFATFTNLEPGDYIFKAKAMNKFGRFGPERQLAIEIKSPWWATNKAYLVYVLLFIALLYVAIYFSSIYINKKNAEEQINFFNNITHEIKTPLAVLLSSLENVSENESSVEQSSKRIKTTIKRINSLFEQMLNFHKVTSVENLELDIVEIHLNNHFKRIIKDFNPLVEERGLEVAFKNHWKDGVFYFDKDILNKIVLNLLSNAIKYSNDNGLILIDIFKTRANELRIEIRDNGLGIPKDQQKYILKKYYRARNAINSQSPGTGLGLMMVQRLIEKTKGDISFVSEEHKGTTFNVTLRNFKKEYFERVNQVVKLNPNPSILVTDQAEIDDFSNSRILIVEDNNELREQLVNKLSLNFQVFEAENGKQGIEKAQEIFPDIILTDLIMPEMDGMEMSRHIKSDINLNHIPIFMLTVLQNSNQKIESIESGISEYIEKPVDIKFLLAKIVNTLKWHKKLRSKYIHEGDSETANIYRNKQDQEFLQNLEETVLENLSDNNYSVIDLSKSFGMSRTSLYMKLKNLVDLSPQDFIIHTKLKHAKSLLVKGELSIKEVAYASGFSNPKYFSTAFKKFYNTTPSNFIESLQQE
ncbi:hybrid sensor histidine kinase/response regulator transcription factor [Aegicerativicinus sediminis]|uniref:hybrid sensor histidine kinase/response regulator transcription factor n=1 Tax=Aegicerativicinus sediminis TaxID=2893202 RepID=UPI001E62DFC2|nr:hybrid sensor histidine kinase/response regulator transcription factor [Aegicerativicinus sediminis]